MVQDEVVRGFLLGLFLGAMFGAGGLYLMLERPWARIEALAEVKPDAGSVKQGAERGERRRRRRNRRRRPGEANLDQIVELTAADRAPKWRGPQVRLPERNLDFGEGGGGRPLRQPEINAGIGSGKRAVIRCIEEARGNAELTATIKLVFLVEGDGRASKLRVRAPHYLMKNGLYDCVSGAVRSMSFTATGAATVVRVPFDLS